MVVVGGETMDATGKTRTGGCVPGRFRTAGDDGMGIVRPGSKVSVVVGTMETGNADTGGGGSDSTDSDGTEVSGLDSEG